MVLVPLTLPPLPGMLPLLGEATLMWTRQLQLQPHLPPLRPRRTALPRASALTPLPPYLPLSCLLPSRLAFPMVSTPGERASVRKPCVDLLNDQNPSASTPRMYEHGLLLLASFPPGAKVKRSEFVSQLNSAVRESGCEISSETARRLLNFLASDEGHRLVHHVARGTTYTLNTESIHRRCAEAAAEVAAAIAAAGEAAALAHESSAAGSPAAASGGPSVDDPLEGIPPAAAAPPQRPRVGLGNPSVLPIRAIVSVMVDFGAVTPDADSADESSVGGYVTVPALARALGVEADVSRDLMAALEAEGFVAAPGYGGASTQKGRAVLVTPRTRSLLRKAQAKLVAAGLAPLPAAVASPAGRSAGSKRSFSEHQLQSSKDASLSGSNVVPAAVAVGVGVGELKPAPARAPRESRSRRAAASSAASAAADGEAAPPELASARAAPGKRLPKPLGVLGASAAQKSVAAAGAWEVDAPGPERAPPVGKSPSLPIAHVWGGVPSLWARPQAPEVDDM